MEKVFKFLELSALDESEWEKVFIKQHANAHKGVRQPLLKETEELLRVFHQPYNVKLAELIGDKGFLWEQEESMSLRQRQLLKLEQGSVNAIQGSVASEAMKEWGEGNKEINELKRRKEITIQKRVESIRLENKEKKDSYRMSLRSAEI